MHGGQQELGLRPGTLPVPLVVGLGLAAELAVVEASMRSDYCSRFRERVLAGLASLRPRVHGDPDRSVPHIVNLSFPGVDAEEAMEAVRDLVAISDGAACTSHSQTCSHVLHAMGLDEEQAAGALRFSWCHLTGEPDWDEVVRAIEPLRGTPERQLSR